MTQNEKPQRDALFLGVDGGGTGCRARLVTTDREVLGEGLAGPASTRFGFDASWTALTSAAYAALAEAGLPKDQFTNVRVGIGVAGFGRAGAQEDFAARSSAFHSVAFVSDAITACLGAHGGGDGAIVIIGTGSCGIARLKGQNFQVGGYGFPISDDGSGAWIGLQALRIAMTTLDNRTRPTLLTEQIMKRFDHRSEKVVAWMDQATATDYATFAPMVVRHADEGDPIARQLMQDATMQIELMCRTLIEKGAVRLSLLGGLSSVIAGWLAPDLRRRLSDPLGDAMDGAIILAGLPFAADQGAISSSAMKS